MARSTAATAASRSKLAVGVLIVPFAVPPASSTEPLVVPVITAASFAPLIVISISLVVPSTVATVNLSCSVSSSFSAWTSLLLSSSV